LRNDTKEYSLFTKVTTLIILSPLAVELIAVQALNAALVIVAIVLLWLAGAAHCDHLKLTQPGKPGER
jgi:hypothetical protein